MDIVTVPNYQLFYFRMLLPMVVILYTLLPIGLPHDPNDDVTSTIPVCDWSEVTTEMSLVATFYCINSAPNGDIDNGLDGISGGIGQISNLGEVEKMWQIEISREYMDSAFYDSQSSHEKRKKRSLPRHDTMGYDEVLSSYVAWRKKNGYGRQIGRWGRDLRTQTNNWKTYVSNDSQTPVRINDHQDDLTKDDGASQMLDMLVSNGDSTNVRGKRSVVDDVMDIPKLNHNKINIHKSLAASRSKRAT